MKIAVLHGQRRKGSTWHITQQLLDKLSAQTDTDIAEFYMGDNTACVGCFSCFLNGENTCPHYGQNQPAMDALEAADLIVVDSPCYCMEMSGQLKVFMDHMAYRWMSHRPSPAMFHKLGVTVSTTAGMGAGRVTKSAARQLFYWGVAKTWRLPVAVGAMGWDTVPEKKKAEIDAKTTKLASKLLRKSSRAKPGLKTRFIFTMMRGMHKGNTWTPRDPDHWRAQGWLDSARPWR